MLDASLSPSASDDMTVVAATQTGLAVRWSEIHGQGVFAERHFDAGDVIEVCPVIVLPAPDVELLEKTSIRGYYYEWNNDGGVALAQGFGSLYNHSWAPNAQYEQDYDAGTISILCVRPIPPGHEITINYTGAPDGRADLWFDTDAPPEP